MERGVAASTEAVCVQCRVNKFFDLTLFDASENLLILDRLITLDRPARRDSNVTRILRTTISFGKTSTLLRTENHMSQTFSFEKMLIELLVWYV